MYTKYDNGIRLTDPSCSIFGSKQRASRGRSSIESRCLWKSSVGFSPTILLLLSSESTVLELDVVKKGFGCLLLSPDCASVFNLLVFRIERGIDDLSCC